jgi:enamine deaminase RidA (YjgF/YER057c/UK114 family)
MHPGDIGAQLAQSLDNLKTVLEQAGTDLSHVVRLNYYTTDVDGLLEAFHVIAEPLSKANCRPASTLLGVARLAFPRHADRDRSHSTRAIVVHCDTEEQARQLQAALTERLGFLGLELHPAKTKIVYCQDAGRRGEAEHTSFDFLGYTFRGRLVRGRRGFFVSFAPAMSSTAKKAKGRQIRAWHLNRRSGSDLSDLARGINPQVRGWINYYGAFYRSILYSLAARIDEHLVRWAMQKFKRLRGRPTRAWRWLDVVRRRQPTLFAHWYLLPSTPRRTVGAV